MPHDETLPRAGSSTGVLTPEDFAERFQRAAPALWCLAASVLGSRHQAEDVLQDAALTGLQKIRQFQPGTRFEAWMGQIVRYTALNQLRRTRKTPASLAPAGAPGIEPVAGPLPPDGPCVEMSERMAQLAQPELFDERVLRALRELREPARSCLLLKTVMEMSYREIADILRIAEGTAMSHVHRARRKMQELLGGVDGASGAQARRIS